MKFLRNFLASFLALVIFSVLGVLVFVGVIAVMSAEETVKVSSKSILHLNLDRPISEVEFENPFGEVGIVASSPSSIGLVQLKEVIAHAKSNENIEGILLESPRLMAGKATVEEIRMALEDFKSSGKFVVAYGEYYTEGAYYLASVADEIYMHPEGDLEFNGLSANVTFLKGLFDKLNIEPQIFRVGQFKSAVEPLMRTDMSEENRLQLTSMLNSINNHSIANVAKSRGLSEADVKQMSEEMLARQPEDAVKYGLLDSLTYYDGVISFLKKKVGKDEDKDLSLVKYEKYKKNVGSFKSSDNEVAVIVASGEITSGEGDMNTIGSDSFVKEIRKARKDDGIKAIVLRINSPGGSFVASDIMWREIKLTSEVKPVIASMSDVAASGGYYMSMACDTIVAQPNTITGSIGIFGVIFNFKDFLNDKLGVTNEEVNTGKFSGMLTVTRPLTEEEKAIVQEDINNGYETFVTKAAQGRGMTVDNIKSVASGRVWTGEQAKNNGLVDILGDFDDAVKIAANAAGVQDDYKVRYYPKQRSIFEEFFKELEGDTKAEAIKAELGELYPYFEMLKKTENLKGVQARLPYELNLN
ncbi:signal peptide peptidase SppA [Fulvivirga sediminis]|uniref:Signal peptide peptidase SppA n=1 Tax=Fulvivirga sediminis TaxID=2803949 RepID=A0A937JYG2_9BACT|nr:signal peptide peptidase SppA [Fulvivirga sediminis]MBL3656393.1 signal peptide peptidase SppA [Fulvivirga sediminis]